MEARGVGQWRLNQPMLQNELTADRLCDMVLQRSTTHH